MPPPPTIGGQGIMFSGGPSVVCPLSVCPSVNATFTFRDICILSGGILAAKLGTDSLRVIGHF